MEFSIERVYEVDATPAQVWRAVNTPQGLASWLFPVDEPDVRPDGDEPYAWGGHVVQAWDVPRHSIVRGEFENGGANQLEYEITDLGEGRSRVRYDHSGIFVGDWQGQYDGADQHTDFYVHSLREYLEFFAPRIAVGYVGVEGPEASRAAGSFERVLAAFGLDATSQAGDIVSIDVEGVGPVAGVVDFLHGTFLGIRTEHELLRVYGREAFAGDMGTALGHHLFDEDADAGVAYEAWKRWLDELFASSAAPR